MRGKIIRFSVAVLCGILGGCADIELSSNPDGIDEMRISPCACAEIEFDQNHQRFVWVEEA